MSEILYIDKSKINFKKIFNCLIPYVLSLTFFIIFHNKLIYITSLKEYDDTLQLNQAIFLSSHQWLGPYTSITLGKGISLPIFIAFIHKIGLSYNTALSILALLSTWLFIIVIRPFVTKTHFFTTASLLILLFNPLMFTQSQSLTYRDSVSYESMIILVTWIIGMALNLGIKLYKSSFILTICCGVIGLPFWINLREDSAWIYPLLIVGILILLLFLLYKKNIKSLINLIFAIALPLCTMFMINGLISYENNKYYDRYVVNEYTSKDFRSAVGTMASVKTNDWIINVPVNNKARKELYKYVPAFSKLKPYLDGNASGNVKAFKYNGRIDKSYGRDYQGGWFPWAYREAVVKATTAKNAKDVERYNKELVNQINEAARKGEINAAKKPRKSLVAPLDIRIIKPVMYETLRVLKHFFLFDGYASSYTFHNNNSGENKRIQEKYADYLRCDLYRKSPTYSDKMMISYKRMFSIILVVATLSFSIIDILDLVLDLRHERKIYWKSLILLGIYLSILLRWVMLGYVSATSFDTMSLPYFSSNYALLYMWMILSIFWKNAKD